MKIDVCSTSASQSQFSKVNDRGGWEYSIGQEVAWKKETTLFPAVRLSILAEAHEPLSHGKRQSARRRQKSGTITWKLETRKGTKMERGRDRKNKKIWSPSFSCSTQSLKRDWRKIAKGNIGQSKGRFIPVNRGFPRIEVYGPWKKKPKWTFPGEMCFYLALAQNESGCI